MMELVGQTPEWRQTLGNLPASSLPTISLAEHDRTLKRVIAELHTAQVERAHVVDVLTRFKTAPLSISSASRVLDLLDELMNGPTSALCGPKEMVHAENL